MPTTEGRLQNNQLKTWRLQNSIESISANEISASSEDLVEEIKTRKIIDPKQPDFKEVLVGIMQAALKFKKNVGLTERKDILVRSIFRIFKNFFAQVLDSLKSELRIDYDSPDCQQN